MYIFFTSSSPCRKDQFYRFIFFYKFNCAVIQVYNWEIRHHSLVSCCGFADILNILANHTFRDSALPKGETTPQDIQPQTLLILKPPSLNTPKPRTPKLTQRWGGPSTLAEQLWLVRGNNIDEKKHKAHPKDSRESINATVDCKR